MKTKELAAYRYRHYYYVADNRNNALAIEISHPLMETGQDEDFLRGLRFARGEVRGRSYREKAVVVIMSLPECEGRPGQGADDPRGNVFS